MNEFAKISDSELIDYMECIDEPDNSNMNHVNAYIEFVNRGLESRKQKKKRMKGMKKLTGKETLLELLKEN